MLEKLFSYRHFLITGLLALFSLGFIVLFRGNTTISPVLQGTIVSVVFFLVIPVLYSKIVLKEPLKNLGWQEGEVLSGTVSGIISVMVGIVALFFFMRFSSFQESYTFPVLVESNFLWFVLYELVLVSFIAMLYEVFFRGLVQILWLKDFGFWAVLIQTGIFWGFFFVNNDFSFQEAPLLIFAPLAGVVAYVSKSIWYSWAASWFFLLLTDVLLLVLH